MNEAMIAVFLASSIRLAAPLILAAMGELISEKAGVLNISAEGIMLIAAFAGAWAAWSTTSATLGVMAGLGAGVVFAALQAWLSVKLRADQIVVGLGFNIFALGLTTLGARLVFGVRSRVNVEGLEKIAIPWLSDLPLIGGALFNQHALVYAAFFSTVVAWVLLHKTAFGIEVEAVGADPKSAEKTGISVARTRVLAVLAMGALCGLGGAFYSVGDIHTFVEGMTNGAGYLAIAAVICGNWKVGQTVGACLLFGMATALQFQLPAMGFDAPVALLVMMPYLAALIAVSGIVGQQRAPAALGLPYAGAR